MDMSVSQDGFESDLEPIEERREPQQERPVTLSGREMPVPLPFEELPEVVPYARHPIIKPSPYEELVSNLQTETDMVE